MPPAGPGAVQSVKAGSLALTRRADGSWSLDWAGGAFITLTAVQFRDLVAAAGKVGRA